MSAKRLNIVLFLFFYINGYSQNWQSLNGGANNYVSTIFGDTVNNLLYATGSFDSIGGVQANRIATWNGISWNFIGSGLLNVSPARFTMYNNQVVFPSSVFTPYSSHITRWDGVQWDTIGSNFSGSFYGAITLNNELYAYGIFDSINHVYYNSIAKWDGLNWISVGFPYRDLGGATPSIDCLAMLNNELYAGGLLADSAGNTVNIAKYNGNYWSIPGSGFQGNMDGVADLEVYQNELYAAGSFKTSSGNPGNYIARWNGTIWRDVGGGVTSPYNSQINDLLLFNNKLYAGGFFTEIGGIPATHIAAWDGTNWCGFGNTDSGSVARLASMNQDLYLTCAKIFDGVTVNYIAKWIGGNFVDTCGNTTGIGQLNINDESFKIYPNPAQSQITIEFDLTETKNVFIEIKNVLGQTVKIINNCAFSIGKNKIVIDVGKFSKGMYFVQLQSVNNSISKKIFVN